MKKEKVKKPVVKKSSKKIKPIKDGFLEYLCYKHSNQIGIEYENLK